ncbi:hypothetical protein SK128_004791 [Halocaridina rubra]|uniref:Uncharacterized protein n=1 Tax=Halocaridina rubra TaxID=373956 RepID=A0AAN9AG93_HALRR
MRLYYFILFVLFPYLGKNRNVEGDTQKDKNTTIFYNLISERSLYQWLQPNRTLDSNLNGLSNITNWRSVYQDVDEEYLNLDPIQEKEKATTVNQYESSVKNSQLRSEDSMMTEEISAKTKTEGDTSPKENQNQTILATQINENTVKTTRVDRTSANINRNHTMDSFQTGVNISKTTNEDVTSVMQNKNHTKDFMLANENLTKRIKEDEILTTKRQNKTMDFTHANLNLTMTATEDEILALKEQNQTKGPMHAKENSTENECETSGKEFQDQIKNINVDGRRHEPLHSSGANVHIISDALDKDFDIGTMAWQMVEKHVPGCHFVIMTGDSRKSFIYRLIRLSSQALQPYVIVDTTWLLENETKFLISSLLGGSTTTCRTLLVDLTSGGHVSIFSLLESSYLWRSPDTSIVFIGDSREVESVLNHRSLRNALRPLYLSLHESLLRSLANTRVFRSTAASLTDLEDENYNKSAKEIYDRNRETYGPGIEKGEKGQEVSHFLNHNIHKLVFRMKEPAQEKCPITSPRKRNQCKEKKIRMAKAETQHLPIQEMSDEAKHRRILELEEQVRRLQARADAAPSRRNLADADASNIDEQPAAPNPVVTPGTQPAKPPPCALVVKTPRVKNSFLYLNGANIKDCDCPSIIPATDFLKYLGLRMRSDEWSNRECYKTLKELFLRYFSVSRSVTGALSENAHYKRYKLPDPTKRTAIRRFYAKRRRRTLSFLAFCHEALQDNLLKIAKYL